MSIGPFIENMPFEMDRDFIPLGQVAQDRIIFSVNSQTPWKTIEDLIAAAKKEPEKNQIWPVPVPPPPSAWAWKNFFMKRGLN